MKNISCLSLSLNPSFFGTCLVCHHADQYFVNITTPTYLQIWWPIAKIVVTNQRALLFRMFFGSKSKIIKQHGYTIAL